MALSAADDSSALKTQKDKVSYAIGMDIGKNLTNQLIDINPEVLAAGLKASYTGSKTSLTMEESTEVMGALRKEMQAKFQAKQAERSKEMAEKNKEATEKNKKEGEAFLAENKKKPGVVTLPSGLQYKVITMGTGKKPTATDTVVTHYRGTFIDGKEFDSSYKRGETFETPVIRVIKGWTEALLLMPVGSKWQLTIPSELAYGPGGQGIPPNSTLLFDMELIAIKDAPKEAAKSPAETKIGK